MTYHVTHMPISGFRGFGALGQGPTPGEAAVSAAEDCFSSTGTSRDHVADCSGAAGAAAATAFCAEGGPIVAGFCGEVGGFIGKEIGGRLYDAGEAIVGALEDIFGGPEYLPPNLIHWTPPTPEQVKRAKDLRRAAFAAASDAYEALLAMMIQITNEQIVPRRQKLGQASKPMSRAEVEPLMAFFGILPKSAFRWPNWGLVAVEVTRSYGGQVTTLAEKQKVQCDLFDAQGRPNGTCYDLQTYGSVGPWDHDKMVGFPGENGVSVYAQPTYEEAMKFGLCANTPAWNTKWCGDPAKSCSGKFGCWFDVANWGRSIAQGMVKFQAFAISEVAKLEAQLQAKNKKDVAAYAAAVEVGKKKSSMLNWGLAAAGGAALVGAWFVFGSKH